MSILINSYNYERFVARTIDSALAQTHRPLEVIVVDDGSTDASWVSIESYGDRIQAVRTANGGQGSAYNEGFARSRGEWVLFLDSDDLLDPGAIDRCLAAATPDVSHVQFRLRLIDPDDRAIGGSIPYQMHSGDVRPIIERFGIYAGPPGSANLYRRSGIAHAFPLDTRHWRRSGADTAPFVASGLTGTIASIDEELGGYRLHVSSNASAGVFGNISKSHRAVLEVEQNLMAAMLEMFGARMTTRTAATLLPTPQQPAHSCPVLEAPSQRSPAPGRFGLGSAGSGATVAAALARLPHPGASDVDGLVCACPAAARGGIRAGRAVDRQRLREGARAQAHGAGSRRTSFRLGLIGAPR